MAPTCPLTESKLAWGAKIATESKLRRPGKSYFFVRGQNHNFSKLRGLKV